MRTAENLAIFICRFSKVPERLNLLQPSLRLYSDTFTFPQKLEFRVT